LIYNKRNDEYIPPSDYGGIEIINTKDLEFNTKEDVRKLSNIPQKDGIYAFIIREEGSTNNRLKKFPRKEKC